MRYDTTVITTTTVRYVAVVLHPSPYPSRYSVLTLLVDHGHLQPRGREENALCGQLREDAPSHIFLGHAPPIIHLKCVLSPSTELLG